MEIYFYERNSALRGVSNEDLIDDKFNRLEVKRTDAIFIFASANELYCYIPQTWTEGQIDALFTARLGIFNMYQQQPYGSCKQESVRLFYVSLEDR